MRTASDMDANIRQLLAVTDGKRLHSGSGTMTHGKRMHRGDGGRVTRGRSLDNGSSNRIDTDATALTLIATELSDKRSC